MISFNDVRCLVYYLCPPLISFEICKLEVKCMIMECELLAVC
jgi:hypothetical protein